MFYYLNGTVAEITGQLAVLDCGGVGFAVNASVNTLVKLKTGERAKLYIYSCIREDAFDLYGFASQDEKRCFELLIGVSGVGPKAALSILSSSTPEALALAIISGNERALTVAPGVGKKLAQRVILELKDKISKDAQTTGFASASPTSSAGAGGGKLTDAAAALAVLGYGNSEIAAALKGLDVDALTLEELIRQALKRMVK